LRIQMGPSPLSKWTPHPIPEPPLLLSPAQEGPGEYESTDKLYVSIVEPKLTEGSSDTSGLCGTIYVHRRTNDTTYERTTYKIMGANAGKGEPGDKGKRFLEALKQVRASVLLPLLFFHSIAACCW